MSGSSNSPQRVLYQIHGESDDCLNQKFMLIWINREEMRGLEILFKNNLELFPQMEIMTAILLPRFEIILIPSSNYES